MLLKLEVNDLLIRFFRASAVGVKEMRIEVGIQIVIVSSYLPAAHTSYLRIFHSDFSLGQNLQFSGNSESPNLKFYVYF
jgi:hypothetical protein